MKMDEHLQALLDYTIFHIGVYLTMGSAIIAAEYVWDKPSKILPVVILLLLIAGAAGGSVASNIPTSPDKMTIQQFLDAYPVLFMGRVLLVKNAVLTQIEHGAFWLAIGLLVIWFLAEQFKNHTRKPTGAKASNKDLPTMSSLAGTFKDANLAVGEGWEDQK